MKKIKVDLFQNLDKWLDLGDTGLQVKVRADDPMGIFYVREKKDKKNGKSLPEVWSGVDGSEDLSLPDLPQDSELSDEL